jgi:hypothetical protein
MLPLILVSHIFKKVIVRELKQLTLFLSVNSSIITSFKFKIYVSIENNN